MKTSQPLRDLAPGVAWNEAQRRSLAICIAGFFVPNLLAEFGAVPELHQSFHFLPGVCGAAGTFLASQALFMGYYHRKLVQGAALAVCSFTLPYLVTWFWFRLRHPSDAARLLQLCGPTCMVSIAAYAFLIWWHARQSHVTVEGLAAQVGQDEYGKPTSRSQQMIIRVSTAIGFVVILLVLLNALSR
jgi:hypothetical protein